MEDDLNGRGPQQKMTSTEDDLTEYDINGRQPQQKMTSMKDDFN